MKQYYAVIWGDNETNAGPNMSDPYVCRITGVSVKDAPTACRECFGMISDNMWIKPLGNKSQVKVRKYRLSQLNDSSGWIRMSHRS